ncbi:hypothetical protein J3R30DRAFT_3446813 [Lentinula aciculospora]|uniref:C2H2-type domain-containing protein n=1 Tax=Lentinula aciculospora TaxID=153920 RepID=A0A9W9DRX3_9AGAR|nr:hypothetical protein J3R30DRAFT_3446813 [Lentinula aciculospora]
MNPSKSQYSSSNQWSSQQHRSSLDNYPSSSSYDEANQHYGTGDPNASYAAGYYTAGHEEYLAGGTSPSSVNPHQYSYSQSVATLPQTHTSGQSQYYSSHSHAHRPPEHSQSSTGTITHTHGHPHHHSVSHPYGQSYMESNSYPNQGRSRSHSHSQMVPPYDTVPMTPPSQYPPQVPLPPSTSMAYAGSPARPFACSLCTLSFSRQHDLKRHRETHTGEKPYLCNGGCGKTFTRKDALKRHQLVKGCGKVDETWS